MGLRTPLYLAHVDAGARMVDFGGWEVPLHYGSQVKEHMAVRNDAGMFDVSHMCVIDIVGGRTRDLLRRLLANDIDKLITVGKALYSCMLSPSGGVIDDLIVYRLPECYRLIVNAGTRTKDLAWISKQAAPFEIHVRARVDLALIAVQGPNARAQVGAILHDSHRATADGIGPFAGAQLGSWFLARTGYTGEEGFEIMLPLSEALTVWRELALQGVVPAGLGARDTLRLEAGMNLYGADMDENCHPLESGLAWTVAFSPNDRDFIGRQALEALDIKFGRELVGLILPRGDGVLRGHQKVVLPGSGVGACGADELILGEITSGTFSPTLNCSIALARVNKTRRSLVQVEIRGKLHNARIVKPPFVRHGKVLVEL